MEKHTHDFIELMLRNGSLRLGEHRLKSNRVAPYYFNIGTTNTGVEMARLAGIYATLIYNFGDKPDVIFGPSYKGLLYGPLIVVALATRGWDIKFSSSRKENKVRGEKGLIIGAEPAGSVMVVDDVLTAGTAFREVQPLIETYEGKVCWFVMGLDRMERVHEDSQSPSARQSLEREGIKTVAAATALDVVTYLKSIGGYGVHVRAIERHLERYGASY